MPAIALITPTRNRGQMLSQTYQSILNQSFPDWQWNIIVDGEDGLKGKIAAHLSQHQKVKVYFIPRVGMTKSVDFGVKISDSKWVGVVDDDDWLHPHCLLQSWEFVQENPCDLAYTKYYEVVGDCFIQGKRSFINYSPDRLLLDFMTFHFRLINRKSLNAIGGINTDLVYAYDYDLCLRMSEVGKIGHVPEYLYYYRHHSDRISTNNRLDQIYYAGKVVQEALKRRGLEKDFFLDVKVTTSLISKKH